MDKKSTIKNYAKILERIGRLGEKTAVLRKTTVLKSLPMTKKTTPSVLNGSVNREANKKTGTVAFAA
ncbi:MAG: hypothetical protein PHD43_03400 [Methylococcales bacterium]|nr:hypothetical protein [Methylococcales bacterium]